MTSNNRLIICLLAGVLPFASCVKLEVPIPPPPPSSTSTGSSVTVIGGISPIEGPLATQVTITGTGFNDTLTLDTVWFNGKQAVINSVTATQIVVTVPPQAGTGVVSVGVKGAVADVSGPTFTYDFQYTVTTLAGGNSNLVDGTGTGAGFGVLNGLTNDGNGSLYVTDLSLGTVRKVTTDKGVVTTITGNGLVDQDADGTLAAAAFATPSDVIVSGSTLFILDGGSGAHCGSIRMISGNNVTTIAGGGTFGANNGTGLGAHFGNLFGFAMDANGNFYVPDPQYNIVRKVTAAGVETTFAGNGGAGYFDATGTQAVFNQPRNVAIDANGNLFVSDQNNNMIRKITPAGVVTTFAGSGASGSTNGTRTSATFSLPADLAFDKNGNLLLADEGNSMIRKITPAGVVTTIAGTGVAGLVDGPGSTAQFGYPTGITVDPSGNIYVTDGSNVVRKIAVQ